MFANRLINMKCIVNRLLLLLLVSSIIGCARKPITSTNKISNYNDYNEDLGEVRPAYKPVPIPVSVKPPTTSTESKKIMPAMSAEAKHVNRRLDEVMEVTATQNRSVRYAPGYRIQIYTGNERQSAEAAKMLVYQNFPELNPYLSYKQPTFRLKIGDFMRKLDAERYYAQLKSLFPSAILQPDKIDIRHSLSIN